MAGFEEIKAKLILFHQSVEKFFEERKKEATPLRAAASVIIPFVLLPAVVYGLGVLRSEKLSNMAAKDPWYLVSSLGGDILLYFGLLMGAIFSYLIVSKVFYKLKINWSASVYAFGVGLMVVFGLGIVTGLFSGFLEGLNNSVIDIFLIIFRNVEDLFFIYLMLVSVRAMTGVSYIKVIGAGIVSFFLFGVVVGIFVLVYYNYVVVPSMFDGKDDTNYDFYFNVTERVDGTMNITHAYIYDWGGIREACYVEFPKGWKQINESDIPALSSRLNYTLSEHSITDIFYNSNKPNLSEFIYFDYGFFASLPFKGGCNTKETLPYWIDDWPEFGGDPKTKWVEIRKDYRICYITALDSNRTTIRHAFYGVFEGYSRGFHGVYETPYEEDQDLNYIMTNIKCI